MVLSSQKAGTRRAVILLVAMATAMFLASSLATVEPAAQTVSSNGKIVYLGFDEESSSSDLYSMNIDGTDLQRLTSNQHEEGTPEWSPDGNKISFHSSAFDNGSCCSRNVYVMNADGSGRQRLTETPSTTEGENFQATWAPDGKWLAFVSTRDESREFSGDREIYVMNADGTEERQLTATAYRTSDEQPSVSPDGTKIAFASNRADTTYGTMDIYVMNADSSNVQRLTRDGVYAYPLEKRSTNPTWSPDGTRIAYESTRDGNSEIYVMNADGSGEPVNVSQDPYWDSDPAWSPDGTRITFTSNRDGQDDIWVVDAPPTSPSTAATFSALDVGTEAALATSAPRNLTASSGLEARSPDWGKTPSNTPPNVGGKLLPADGATTTDATPAIGAKVTDAETELTMRNVAVLLDGAKVDRARLVYNPDTLRVRYVPGTDLSPGNHIVRVVARDPQGLVTRRSWSFNLVQP